MTNSKCPILGILRYACSVFIPCLEPLAHIFCWKPTWNLPSRSSAVLTSKKSSLNPQAALKDPFSVSHCSKKTLCPLLSHCVVQWFVCLSNDPSPKLWTLMSSLISQSRPYPSTWRGPDTRRCLVTVGLPQAPLSLYLSAAWDSLLSFSFPVSIRIHQSELLLDCAEPVCKLCAHSDLRNK